MQNSSRVICSMFENEGYLYIDKTLTDERIEFWRTHLRQCDYCRENLKITEEILSDSSTKLLVDLDENVFNKMVENAVKKRKYDFAKWFHRNRIRQIYTVGKIAFASILVIAAVVVSLLSDKPNTLKSVSKELLDWEGKEIRTELNNIGSRIQLIRNDNMEGWSRDVNTLGNRLNILERQLDPDSFY